MDTGVKCLLLTQKKQIIISFSFLLLYQLLMSLCINFICSVHILLEWLSALLPFPSQDLIAFNLLSIFSDPFFLALVPISAYSFFILFSRLVLLLIQHLLLCCLDCNVILLLRRILSLRLFFCQDADFRFSPPPIYLSPVICCENINLLLHPQCPFSLCLLHPQQLHFFLGDCSLIVVSHGIRSQLMLILVYLLTFIIALEFLHQLYAYLGNLNLCLLTVTNNRDLC